MSTVVGGADVLRALVDVVEECLKAAPDDRPTVEDVQSQLAVIQADMVIKPKASRGRRKGKRSDALVGASDLVCAYVCVSTCVCVSSCRGGGRENVI